MGLGDGFRQVLQFPPGEKVASDLGFKSGWGQAVIFVGCGCFHHHLQLASHNFSVIFKILDKILHLIKCQLSNQIIKMFFWPA